MIHDGVLLKARHLAVQHGDGKAITDFWRHCLHTYDSHNKVT